MDISQAADQDQQWFLSCLNAALDSNHDVRTFAEATLQQASQYPGYCAALMRVAINKELPVGSRQLAAVLLKQFVKQHWQEDDEISVPPVISTTEKALIRHHLLLALDDPHRKICTAVSMAVASIAHYDWPESWPDLLPFLLKLISNHSSINGVCGALKCFTLLSDDLDDWTVPKLVPALFPSLYTVISSPQIYGKSLCAKALSLVSTCTDMIGSMSSIYRTETEEVMRPMMKPWMEQCSFILQPPVHWQDPDDLGIRMEASKCLVQFVQNFPTLAKAELGVILEHLWQTFVSCLNAYVSSSVQGVGDSFSGSIDSDGSERSLESFAIQLFELLLTIVSNRKLLPVIQCRVKGLVYYTIAFLQMTEEQVLAWSVDVNQYVADEDNSSSSCRTSGALLLEELISLNEVDGVDIIIEAAEKQFNESCHAKAAGLVGWWKLQEASVYALCSISESASLEEVSDQQKSMLVHLLEQLLPTNGETGVHGCPFLHARAFVAVARLSDLIGVSLLEKYLLSALNSVATDVPPVVKVGACRAISQLLPKLQPNILQPDLINLLTSLTELIKQSSDEMLHIVLEALQAVVKAGHHALAAVEPQLSTFLLNMWAQHVSDPFMCISFIEVLREIKRSPGCLHPLVYQVLASVGPILKQPSSHTGLVAASLDLLTMLLKNSPLDIVKVVYEACFNHVARIVLESGDHNEAQNATECLAAFVFGGKEDLLAWGGDPDCTMKSLLEAASRLLDPNLECSISLFVGTYILQLILHLPNQMAFHIQDLVAALVRRLRSCGATGLRSSLLLVFARLVHLSAPNVEHFINLMVTLPAEGHAHSLAYVMVEWTKHQGEIQGAYVLKVTVSALALLLSTKHPELGRIYVQGHLIKTSNEIITRSKAKVLPDQWTVMSLPAKILALLADMLIELDEQCLNQNLQDDSDSPGNGLELCDPINEINLFDYLHDFLVKVYHNNRALFDHLSQSLTLAQKNALERTMKQ